MTNGIIENPFDKDTKPWDEFNEVINTIGPNVAKCEGNEGKILKVRSDGKGTYWSASGGGGTTDYDELSNRPKIAGITLAGNKSLVDLGILKNNFGTSEVGKVLKVGADGYVTAETGSSGTTDYTSLTNKPKINNVELNGNVSIGDIGAFKKDWDTATYEGYVVKIVSGVATPVPGSTASVAFADITGSPYDNASLTDALDDKLSLTQDAADKGKVPMVANNGKLVMSDNVAKSVDWGGVTGNIADNAALTAALNARVPLSPSSNAITGFGVDASGNLYVDLP